jgi:hypothetical protein
MTERRPASLLSAVSPPPALATSRSCLKRAAGGVAFAAQHQADVGMRDETAGAIEHKSFARFPDMNRRDQVHSCWSVVLSRKPWILPAAERASAWSRWLNTSRLVAVAKPRLARPIGEQRRDDRDEQRREIFLEQQPPRPGRRPRIGRRHSITMAVASPSPPLGAERTG